MKRILILTLLVLSSAAAAFAQSVKVSGTVKDSDGNPLPGVYVIDKQAKAKGEDAKVSVRNIRRKAMEELHRIRKDGEAGEDEVGRAEKDLDKTTHGYVGQIDELVKHKESELLEV